MSQLQPWIVIDPSHKVLDSNLSGIIITQETLKSIIYSNYLQYNTTQETLESIYQ